MATETLNFNRTNRFMDGWYWAMRSTDLKIGKTKAIRILGRDLVLFRTPSGVKAMDAYCPHMGSHLVNGTVEGESIRCMFHFWKFSTTGECVEIPCQKHTNHVPKIKTWLTKEHYGLIWIYPGTGIPPELPEPAELRHSQVDAGFGGAWTKNCHPNVVMINAIDAQHFASVHNLRVDFEMKPEARSTACIEFKNQTPFPKETLPRRIAAYFYNGRLTYDLAYWYGSVGSVTLGPDFLHFHVMFAIRPNDKGQAEGCTLLLTKGRGRFGQMLINPILKGLTFIVAKYFAKGDTIIFENIKFDFKTPIKADRAIIEFVKHAELQPALTWGTWEPISYAATTSHMMKEQRGFDAETI